MDLLRYCVNDVQVLLLDYSMPVLNGAETLKYVRRLAPHIKIVAVTGCDIYSLPASFREGVDQVVAKPFTCADLVAVINQLLAAAPTLIVPVTG